MKPLLTGACIAALAPFAVANTGSGSDWLGLDDELNAVASNLSTQGGGVEIGALFRGAYVSTSGDDFGTFADGNGDGQPDDQLGLTVDDVEIWGQGQVGDWFWRLSVDFGNDPTIGDSTSPYFLGNLLGANTTLKNTSRQDVLEDAYAEWRFNEQFSLRIGHFVFPTTFSAGTNPDSLLLAGRTSSGEFFHMYDLGAMLSGDYEQFEWHVAVLNGADGTGDGHRLAARGIFNLGTGANATEGALGANDELNAAIGLGYWTDDAVDDLTGQDSAVIVIDGTATLGAFSFAAEWVSYDDAHAGVGFGGAIGLNYTEGMSVIAGTLGYLLSEEWEIAGRYETLDDADDTTIMSLGVNYYQAGHDAKWQLLFMDVGSDVAANEGTVIALGLSVGTNG